MKKKFTKTILKLGNVYWKWMNSFYFIFFSELYILGSQYESNYLPSTQHHKLLFQKNEIDQWIEGNLVNPLKNFLVKLMSQGVAWLLKSGFHWSQLAIDLIGKDRLKNLWKIGFKWVCNLIHGRIGRIKPGKGWKYNRKWIISRQSIMIEIMDITKINFSKL